MKNEFTDKPHTSKIDRTECWVLPVGTLSSSLSEVCGLKGEENRGKY